VRRILLQESRQTIRDDGDSQNLIGHLSTQSSTWQKCLEREKPYAKQGLNHGL